MRLRGLSFLFTESMFAIIVMWGCGTSTSTRPHSENRVVESPVTKQVSNTESKAIPDPPLEVAVSVQKWTWDFTYDTADGLVTSNVLYVPVDRDIRLSLQSEDVLHEFVLNKRGVSVQISRGEHPIVSFDSGATGQYRISCNIHESPRAEAELVVLESAEYESTIAEMRFSKYGDCRDIVSTERSACVEWGERVYMRYGCNQCHSVDGSFGIGPSFEGLWGQTRKFADGRQGVVDEDFVRESLHSPLASVRDGFSPVMPSFRDKLAERELFALLEWLQTL